MKIINKIIWFILIFPVVGNAQVLGPDQGNNVEISSIAGASQNSFMNKQWLYRSQNGNDWTSTRLHNGISIDNSFLVPGVSSKTWWERDPYNNVQSWGNAANTYLTINQGNIGIGTADPGSRKLKLVTASAETDVGIEVEIGRTTGTNYGVVGKAIGFGANTNIGLFTAATGATSNLGLRIYNVASATGSYAIYSDSPAQSYFQGNVGIGIETPTDKLVVNGNIRAREIKVENANWPDYVFTRDYQLPTLQQTENHIKEKGHLPGIPSAAEVKANGIDLGEMNAKLLQKIEELTLHLTEKEKQLNHEKNINLNQEDRLKQLELKIEQLNK
ncbi:hypothetical protein [Pedobacter heparinus]|uniref:Uncharacterized protein n=1 Tax=Pedobacter heparinus (strain ATCC 13125 / DSM 2366 / CIP 104194 / JCM 7457 / NBRC 12017 / NCIMB 9290 / NRRL B-14731 / HIM 762-3) TaxID=485917 RepID=C6Y3K2_PEDHD|nr:hypothetical protein [Pedobacter heparinus]ACU03281.1 hypothetical protein Phep_1062 [Pedobacter heparinus DSM 2366]